MEKELHDGGRGRRGRASRRVRRSRVLWLHRRDLSGTRASLCPSDQDRQAGSGRRPGGQPGEREAEFRAAGFDDFIPYPYNLRTTLSQLQRLAGVHFMKAFPDFPRSLR